MNLLIEDKERSGVDALALEFCADILFDQLQSSSRMETYHPEDVPGNL